MASLKDLRGRINSVKSTRKITSAMKMVAASSKLRRAQAAAEAARPYAERMSAMLSRLAANVAGTPGAPSACWWAQGSDQVHLVIAMTADRGLAGAFNSGVGRQARSLVRRLLSRGQDGENPRRGPQGARLSASRIRRQHGRRPGFGWAQDHRIFAAAREVADRVFAMFERNEFDVATIVYNQFKSVIAQIPTEMQIIPLPVPAQSRRGRHQRRRVPSTSSSPTKKPSSSACCRKTSPSSSIAPCWRATPASTARK